MTEWESLFAKLIVERPLLIKSVMWDVLGEFYKKNNWDLSNIKNDGYACKQLLIQIVVKNRVCTTGARQPSVVQRLLQILEQGEPPAKLPRKPSGKVSSSASASQASKLGPVVKSEVLVTPQGRPRSPEPVEEYDDTRFVPSKEDLKELRSSWKNKVQLEHFAQEVQPLTWAKHYFPSDEEADVLEKQVSSNAASSASFQTPSRPAVQANIMKDAGKVTSMYGSMTVTSLKRRLEPDNKPESGSATIRKSAKNRSVADVLSMYGASHLDKSAPPVPPAAAAILQDLLQDKEKKPSKTVVEQQQPKPSQHQQMPEFQPKPDAQASIVPNSYDQELKSWQGTKQEWLDSSIRSQCIQAMPRSEVVKRRFERFRPDLFLWDDSKQRWSVKQS